MIIVTIADIALKGGSLETNMQGSGHTAPKTFQGQTFDYEGNTWHFVANAVQTRAQSLDDKLTSLNLGPVLWKQLGHAVYVLEESQIAMAQKLLNDIP